MNRMIFRVVAVCLLGALSLTAQVPDGAQLFTKLYEPIEGLPRVALEWSVERAGRVRTRIEFVHDSGRFIHKEFRISSKGERLFKMLSFDGDSYYHLQADVLTVATSLEDEFLLDNFQPAFKENPVFFPFAYSFTNYPIPFSLPGLRTPSALMPNWLQIGITQVSPGLFERKDGVNIHRIGLENGRVKYGDTKKGEFEMKWTIEDWMSADSGNKGYQVPRCIKVVRPETQRLFFDCLRMNKFKLVENPIPVETFRIPSSMAREIQDLDLSNPLIKR